jgi:hypothetical protein
MRLSRLPVILAAGMFLLLQGCSMQDMQPLLQGLAGVLGNGGNVGGGPLAGPLAGPLPGQNPGQTPPGTPPAPPKTPAGPPVPGNPPAAGTFAELDAWQGGALPPDQFFRMLAPAVMASSRQTGVPAAVTLAQAALETGYGKSTIGDAKNLFGVKGEGPAGSVDHVTREVEGGQSVTITAKFRKYNSWYESIVDHDTFLQKPRYANAMAVRNDPEAFARAIADAGYATDPSYADQLISIMKRYNLVQLTSGASS